MRRIIVSRSARPSALPVAATQKVSTHSLCFAGGNEAQSLPTPQEAVADPSLGIRAFMWVIPPLLACRPLWVSNVHLSQKRGYTWAVPMVRRPYLAR